MLCISPYGVYLFQHLLRNRVSNLGRLCYHKLKFYVSMFPLPCNVKKGNGISGAYRRGAIYQHVWVRGSKGQRHGNPGQTGMPSTLGRPGLQHISMCHNYIQKYRHTCLEMCRHTGDGMGVTCPVVPFSALLCSDSWELPVRVTSNCENVGLCDSETQQELLLLDQTREGERER